MGDPSSPRPEGGECGFPLREGGAPAREEELFLEAGQQIRGTVEIRGPGGRGVQRGPARFVWHTEGKGNRATGEGGTLVLHRTGEWTAGTCHEFPFEVVAPRGPLSYEGRILNVLWSLEARVDRAMLWPDVHTRIPVHLWGSPDPEKASLGPSPR